MNLTRIGVLFVRLGILVTVGCVSHPPFPESSLTGKLFEVKISESVTPKMVIAKRGDEVRWVNTRSVPVDIIFAQSQDEMIPVKRGLRRRIGQDRLTKAMYLLRVVVPEASPRT